MDVSHPRTLTNLDTFNLLNQPPNRLQNLSPFRINQTSLISRQTMPIILLNQLIKVQPLLTTTILPVKISQPVEQPAVAPDQKVVDVA